MQKIFMIKMMCCSLRQQEAADATIWSNQMINTAADTVQLCVKGLNRGEAAHEPTPVDSDTNC